MEYDYGRGGQGSGGYEMGRPMYRGNQPANNASFYPRISQSPGSSSISRAPPPSPPVSNPSPPSGTGIKVAMKPVYRVGPPAQLMVQSREVPRSLFQFEFDLERRILAEAELQGNRHVRASTAETSQANGEANFAAIEDATVVKYLSMGLSKEAVQYALQIYGDTQIKILDFCPSYTKIRDMGFPPDRVAGALAKFDNDEERAISSLV